MVQVFHPLIGSRPILGVVGELQFDVLASRVRQEYSVPLATSRPRAMRPAG